MFEQIPDVKVENIAAAKKSLSAVKRPSSHSVLWYGTKDPDLLRVRSQAAASFPVLAGMIADNPILSRAVDEQISLQPLLIERSGLSKAGLKRIGRLSESLPVGRIFEEGEVARGEDALGVNRLRRFTVSGEISLDIALKHLAELPPDRVPQDNESWLAYHDILAGCAIPIENALDVPIKKTLSACKGDWVNFKAQLAKAADFQPENFDRRSLALSTIDALEAIEDLSKTAVLPVALSSITSVDEAVPEVSSEFFIKATQVAGDICLGKSKNIAVSLLEMARRYSSRIPTLNTHLLVIENENTDARFAKYGSEAFPRFTEPYQAKNGLVIRAFENFKQMSRESARLKHCLGRVYTRKARECGGFFLSVQDMEGKNSYSTIELTGISGDTVEEARSRFEVIQHRAYNNATPSKECSEAFDEFMDQLRKGYLPINFDEIVDWRASNIDAETVAITTWAGVTETDWEDENVRQSLWEEWRYIIGGQYGKAAQPEVIFREKGARDLVAAMNAHAASLLIEKSKKPAPKPEEDSLEMAGP